MATCMGATHSGGPGIVLAIRPGTEKCPRIRGYSAIAKQNGNNWPSCQYTLPTLVGLLWPRFIWWTATVLDIPTAYTQIRKGGLGLEGFKGCSDLREVFVSGQVLDVTVGEGYPDSLDGTASFGSPILVIKGRSTGEAPPLNWCLSSGGLKNVGEDGREWRCTLSSPPKNTPIG
ncbi:hypothetical protein CDD81_5217 [Ophiocordyceps australis]|uniref:Uncharacterized protein n=1 Tax=Ophiocordyceps australis TaxID=1399860 RepID=A0A2C5YBI9_9HYPO|nr:hypothetical protein CDD81_5217 [Ophiocordyceps australis]